MEKVRIRDLAKDLGMEHSRDILAFLEKIGVRGENDKKVTASSGIAPADADRAKAHFNKPTPPPPPPATVTHKRADGTVVRQTGKVLLRRAAPPPPPAPEPPPPVVPEPPPVVASVVAPPSPVVAPPASPSRAAETLRTIHSTPRRDDGSATKPGEPVPVEQTPASKSEEERKDREKKAKKIKPHEKKVQKGVLKKVMIQEIDEPETAAVAVAPVPEKAPEAVVRQFQPHRHVQQKRQQQKFQKHQRHMKHQKTTSTLPLKESKRIIKIEEVITVGDLAHRMGVKVSEIIKKLLENGMPTTVNQTVDVDTAKIIAADYQWEVENVAPEVEALIDQAEDAAADLVPRPPVVTIMGHVDHGKTSLLDAIRMGNVADKEAGGITQHIGAYEVRHNGRDIVFLDTPGHEAFTAMRARGAQVTDIVILVVAADDGAMPQTIEAIDHAKAAGVPIIVAVNKIDKAGAQPDRIRQQLSDHGLVPEEWGGQALYANVSAKKKEGLDHLMELVILQADMLDLKANPNKHARGTVIESRIEKGRGPVATVLVSEGTLRVGDAVVCNIHYGRVRSLHDHKGKRFDSVPPGTPIEIHGLNGLPAAGQKFAVLKDERTARQIALHREEKEKEKDKGTGQKKFSLEDLHRRIEAGDLKELKIVLKVDVQGSVEAIQFSLNKLSGAKVKVNVIHAGVGNINEGDVMLATASDAVVIGFNVKPEPKAAEVAEREKIDMRFYSVIYEAIDDIVKAMEGLLAPTFKETTQGRVEVRSLFKISRFGTIAGSFVLSGKITRNAPIRVLRDGKVVHEGKLDSLKRFKDDVKEVVEGYECGILVDGYDGVQVGDVVESFILEKVIEKL